MRVRTGRKIEFVDWLAKRQQRSSEFWSTTHRKWEVRVASRRSPQLPSTSRPHRPQMVRTGAHRDDSSVLSQCVWIILAKVVSGFPAGCASLLGCIGVLVSSYSPASPLNANNGRSRPRCKPRRASFCWQIEDGLLASPTHCSAWHFPHHLILLEKHPLTRSFACPIAEERRLVEALEPTLSKTPLLLEQLASYTGCEKYIQNVRALFGPFCAPLRSRALRERHTLLMLALRPSVAAVAFSCPLFPPSHPLTNANLPSPPPLADRLATANTGFLRIWRFFWKLIFPCSRFSPIFRAHFSTCEIAIL